MEGCGYRDRYDQFQAMGIEIIGVSYGSPEDHLVWAEQEGFQFELWTDEDRQLSIAYGSGSKEAVYPERNTFLLNREGDLILEYRDVLNAGAHPQEVLDDCLLLFGGE